MRKRIADFAASGLNPIDDRRLIEDWGLLRTTEDVRDCPQSVISPQLSIVVSPEAAKSAILFLIWACPESAVVTLSANYCQPRARV